MDYICFLHLYIIYTNVSISRTIKVYQHNNHHCKSIVWINEPKEQIPLPNKHFEIKHDVISLCYINEFIVFIQVKILK